MLDTLPNDLRVYFLSLVDTNTLLRLRINTSWNAKVNQLLEQRFKSGIIPCHITTSRNF
jgi:hypothetical protein